MKIISVVGARPNFMKVAPFIREIEEFNKNGNSNITIEHILIHTGQHYDDRMSKAFFKAFSLPEADINLGVGSGTHAEQVGLAMIKLEKVFIDEKPDWVVVYGDVNATLSASVTAKKLFIKVCHVEAGLRSRDMRMPEEINRLVTDRLSDLLLTPDLLSVDNLVKEGMPDSKIKFVGNIMIDTLVANKDKAIMINPLNILKDNFIVQKNKDLDFSSDFGVITLHRPSNVDDRDILTSLVNLISDELSQFMPIIWTVHPRTEKQLKKFQLWEKIIDNPRLYFLYPLNYHEMLKLNMMAKVILTGSGGLQEECTVLGTPCLTMRWNTERPVTLTENGGASVLVGNDINKIRDEFNKTIKKQRSPVIPELWDGHTAQRCLDSIINFKNAE